MARYGWGSRSERVGTHSVENRGAGAEGGGWVGGGGGVT